jgi:hypothetical protein
MKNLIILLAVVSMACTLQLAPVQQVAIVEKVVVSEPSAAPTPPTSDMTVTGTVRLRDAPDNTGSRTLVILQSGEIFHVQSMRTVLSTDWAYGSWYNEETDEWMVGYVAARFLR